MPEHHVANRNGRLSGQLHFNQQYSMAHRLIDGVVPVVMMSC